MKYPDMFRRSSVLVNNKTDLLGHSDFDLERAENNARRINPKLRIFRMSCRTGEVLPEWYAWLREISGEKKDHR